MDRNTPMKARSMKLKHLALTLSFACASLCAHAQTPANEELRQLIQADHSDRSTNDIDWAVVDQRDKARAARVLGLLGEAKIRTAEDYYNAAMIFQHGSSAEDIQLALALATLASRLAPDHPAPKWLMAAAWDRYMIWKKQPQWYGTQSQIDRVSGKHLLYPVLANAVSDEERAQMAVPPLAQSIADIEAQNR
jgi:hypothetical protein